MRGKNLKKKKRKTPKKPQVSKIKEIIKIRAKLNEIVDKKTIENINATKSWFIEKINKVDKPLGLTKQMRKNSIKIRNKRE